MSASEVKPYQKIGAASKGAPFESKATATKA
jgi:hypothetical protein